MKKFISAITAAALLVAPVCSTAYAAEKDEIVRVEPVFSEFNESDVSGGIIITIPEKSAANVKITFESPEPEVLYYETTLKSENGLKYLFELEGYDTEIDENKQLIDGRLYTISISVEDIENKLTSGVYTSGMINIPDSNNNGGVEKYEFYTLKIAQSDNENPYDVDHSSVDYKGMKCNEKIVTFYVDESIVMGDVNGDALIDSRDASAVLSEYARTSTNQAASFTEMQTKAADVNGDGKVNSVDASKILAYYALTATGGTPTWD